MSSFYKRFSGPNMTLDMLSHLEHFVIAKNAKNEEGRRFIEEKFSDPRNNEGD